MIGGGKDHLFMFNDFFTSMLVFLISAVTNYAPEDEKVRTRIFLSVNTFPLVQHLWLITFITDWELLFCDKEICTPAAGQMQGLLD